MKEKTNMILGAATVAALLCACTSEPYEAAAPPESLILAWHRSGMAIVTQP